jgi:hypothetical protein
LPRSFFITKVFAPPALTQSSRRQASKVEQRASDPAGRVLAIFDILAERFDEADFRGCAFTNTIVETADRRHPAHQAAAAHKAFLGDYLLHLLQAAEVKNAASLAAQILLLIDGAFVTALREGTSQAATRGKQAAATLLQATGLSFHS